MMPFAHIGDTFSEGSHQVLHNVKCFLIIKMVNRFITFNADKLCLMSTYEMRVTEDSCGFFHINNLWRSDKQEILLGFVIDWHVSLLGGTFS